jgi:hypothetical protein
MGLSLKRNWLHCNITPMLLTERPSAATKAKSSPRI